uniref:Gustatory receptor 2a n=1 Tax=Diabrotica virgifera virgifera TaxID=50390 RepID=A0A6P7G3H0_DIAVI
MTVLAIDTEADVVTKVSQFFYPVPFTIFLVVLVMACDAVESSGNQIIKTCHILSETLQDADHKEHLLLLAKYAQHWRPVFSAAGFYDVNQSCLSSIFSAVVTYLVIIIQFNMVLTN